MRSDPSPVFTPVVQEHSLGCAVACVASRSGISYRRALALFSEPMNAWTRGFYCSEVAEALAQAGFTYAFAEFNPSRHRRFIETRGTLVFVGPCAEYPSGHYLLRDCDGWMNPWANFPQMIPVEAKHQALLAPAASYLLYETV